GLATPNTVKEILESAKNEAQQWFDKIKEKIDEGNTNNLIQLQTEVVVTGTSIVSAIVQYAKNKEVDLIVIGTRGRSGLKKLLLGSVASGVITYAECAVMVVKAAYDLSVYPPGIDTIYKTRQFGLPFYTVLE